MAICKHYNTPKGCKFGDNCKFEHIDDSSSSSSSDDDDNLNFVMRSKPLPIRCCVGFKCGRLCYFDQPLCSKPKNKHKINWENASCNICFKDVDNDSITYPDDWPYPGYIWLKYCPHCGDYLHGGFINDYNVFVY